MHACKKKALDTRMCQQLGSVASQGAMNVGRFQRTQLWAHVGLSVTREERNSFDSQSDNPSFFLLRKQASEQIAARTGSMFARALRDPYHVSIHSYAPSFHRKPLARQTHCYCCCRLLRPLNEALHRFFWSANTQITDQRRPQGW
jgi:hypothetical protein